MKRTDTAGRLFTPRGEGTILGDPIWKAVMVAMLAISVLVAGCGQETESISDEDISVERAGLEVGGVDVTAEAFKRNLGVYSDVGAHVRIKERRWKIDHTDVTITNQYFAECDLTPGCRAPMFVFEKF